LRPILVYLLKQLTKLTNVEHNFAYLGQKESTTTIVIVVDSHRFGNNLLTYSVIPHCKLKGNDRN